MPASAAVELEILRNYLAGEAPTKPTKLWLALCEEEPTRDAESKTLPEAGKGKELAYPGYERIEIKAEPGQWNFVAGTAIALAKALNKNPIVLHAVTGANERNKAAYYALVLAAKSSEAGKLIFYGQLGELLEITKALAKVEFAAEAFEAAVE